MCVYVFKVLSTAKIIWKLGQGPNLRDCPLVYKASGFPLHHSSSQWSIVYIYLGGHMLYFPNNTVLQSQKVLLS